MAEKTRKLKYGWVKVSNPGHCFYEKDTEKFELVVFQRYKKGGVPLKEWRFSMSKGERDLYPRTIAFTSNHYSTPSHAMRGADRFLKHIQKLFTQFSGERIE